MLSAGVLTFQEFITQEPLPLAAIHNAVLEFLRDRNDVVVFGAQAVNAYVQEPRMTQDIDLVSIRAADIAQELREYLGKRFYMAAYVRTISEGRGYRLYQIQKSGNRHLVDVRPVDILPAAQRIEKVLVVAPAELIASKVMSYYRRRGQPKSGTDWRDIALLLLTFPELKCDSGSVVEQLKILGADAAMLDVWKEIVAQDIRLPAEDDEF